MRSFRPRTHAIAGILIAVLAGVLSYLPWLVAEFLHDFMRISRHSPALDLLLMIFLPTVLFMSGVWWLCTRGSGEFVASVLVSSVIMVVALVVAHQATLDADSARSNAAFKAQAERLGAEAAARLQSPDAVAHLKPPLDPYEQDALATRVHKPDLDGALLHRLLVAFPDKLQCEIPQNPNALSEDLAAIWKEQACSDFYFATNPHTPVDILSSIYEQHRRGLNGFDAAVRDEAAFNLAASTCDPELLNAMLKEYAERTQSGTTLRMHMASNVCTPTLFFAQIVGPEFRDVKAQAAPRRAKARVHREVAHVQDWMPQPKNGGAVDLFPEHDAALHHE